ncbi:Lar family restriction alleviation protein [[Clostridium] symbiosum]|uniref:Lar family restriction alleviation protein n=1 Tax=Clostridium symbiosum TaxID=1512 RepID=UPI0020561EE4|nr:MAG TPA: restriction alleviation protein [Caudoviricetes sp.]
MTQIIEVNNLKPCPFCGGEAELRTQENPFGHMTARITCKRCHCTSPHIDGRPYCRICW